MNLAAAVLGLVSHLCYFKRGEHQLYGARYIVTSLFLFVAALCFVGFKGKISALRLTGLPSPRGAICWVYIRASLHTVYSSIR